MTFDDDENPNATGAYPPVAGEDGAPTAEDAAEEGIPDYKLFSSMVNKKKVSSKNIRKGEKDFESHGTQAQDNTLEASRQALEEVLSYTRIHREEAWVRGWYCPEILAECREDDAQPGINVRDRVVVVEHQRGNWMRDTGRTVSGKKDLPGAGKLWLLPEEALYLVERGTLDLWWPYRPLEELLPEDGAPEESDTLGPDDYDVGLPLSLEAAYSMLLGSEGERGKVSLSEFQVYAHLKRSGFNVLRAPENAARDEPSTSNLSTPWEWLLSLARRQQPVQHPPPSGPLITPGLYRAYAPIYQKLAIIPRHKPGPAPTTISEPEKPFKIFYHVWKPSPTPFSKKNPPPPDFRIAVSDTINSFIPTLEEITALLDSTPYNPPGEWMQAPGRINQRLKHGHRNVLVAVVDCGLVNFIRFGEAAFGEERLYERFDSKRGGARGGKKSGRGGGRGRGRGRGRGGGGRGS